MSCPSAQPWQVLSSEKAKTLGEKKSTLGDPVMGVMRFYLEDYPTI
jgi:hypothetical protein